MSCNCDCAVTGGCSVGAWWASANDGRALATRTTIRKSNGCTNNMDCLTDWDQTRQSHQLNLARGQSTLRNE